MEIWQQGLYHLSASFLPGRHSSWPFFKVTKTESSLIWLMEHVGSNTQHGWKHWGYFINSLPRTCTKPRQQPICPLCCIISVADALIRVAHHRWMIHCASHWLSFIICTTSKQSLHICFQTMRSFTLHNVTWYYDISRKADMNLTQTSTDTWERYSVVSFYKGSLFIVGVLQIVDAGLECPQFEEAATGPGTKIEHCCGCGQQKNIFTHKGPPEEY